MAVESSGNKMMDEIYDQFLVCKICYDIYKSPKTLSCLHTFCQDCLEKHQEAELERSYRYLLYSRAVTCPICRKKTEIPTGGIRRLPDNFLVANLNDVVNRRKPNTKASICEICKPSPPSTGICAVSKCLDCSKMLCRNCVELHRKTKVTQSHGLYDIEVAKDIDCKVHSEEVVRFYCEPCEQCICVVCTFQEHKGHDVSSFTEGIDRYRKSLDILLSKCRDRVDYLKEQLIIIETCDADLKQSEEQIREMAIESISAIRKKEKEMVKDLYRAFGTEAIELIKGKDQIQENMDSLQSTCNLTDIILRDKSVELLLLKREIQEKLATLLQRNVHDIPENINRKIRFVPGNLVFGYLNIDGNIDTEDENIWRQNGSPEYFCNGEINKSSCGSNIQWVHSGSQTDVATMKEDCTTMGKQMLNFCSEMLVQTEKLPTRNASTDPLPPWLQKYSKSKFTMTTPDVKDRQTMVSMTTPTMKRKVQTDHVQQTDQATGTCTPMSPSLSHKSMNTNTPQTIDQSTLTIQKNFCDQITETKRPPKLSNQQTATMSVQCCSTAVGTEMVNCTNKATLTEKPFSADKKTSTMKRLQNTVETNTPFVAMLDMGVHANMYGTDRATSTRVIVTTDMSSGNGDVRTSDEGVDTPWGRSIYHDKDTMCAPEAGSDMSTGTDIVPTSDKGFYTEYFNMLDKTIETERKLLRTVETLTDMMCHIDSCTNTDIVEVADMGVNVNTIVSYVKPDTADLESQTDVTFNGRLLWPNMVACDKETSPPPRVLFVDRNSSPIPVCGTHMETNTDTCSTAEFGMGTINPEYMDSVTNTRVIETMDIDTNTNEVSTLEKSVATYNAEITDCGVGTDAVMTKDSSHDAFRGLFEDMFTNTDVDLDVRPRVELADVTTGTEVVMVVNMATHTVPCDVKDQVTFTETPGLVSASCNTENHNVTDGTTSMDSHVSVCDVAMATRPISIREASSNTNIAETAEFGMTTIVCDMRNFATETDRYITKNQCTGTPEVRVREKQTETFHPTLIDSGVSPIPLDVTHQETCMPQVSYSHTGVGTPVILVQNKGIDAPVTERKDEGTYTFIPTVEKATYMPQTITMSTGMGTVGPELVERKVNTDPVDNMDIGTMTPVVKQTTQFTSMFSTVEVRDSDTSTTVADYCDTGSDADMIEVESFGTNTPTRVTTDSSMGTDTVDLESITTTTNHSVFMNNQETTTGHVEFKDVETGMDVLPSLPKNKHTSTAVEMRSVGVLKRPHLVTRGAFTPKIPTSDRQTCMDPLTTSDGVTMTLPPQVANKQVMCRPFGLKSRGTTTPAVKLIDCCTEMPVSQLSTRASSPIFITQLVDRQCSPITVTEHTDRASSPVLFSLCHKDVMAQPWTEDRFTSTAIIDMKHTGTSPSVIEFLHRSTSPIIFDDLTVDITNDRGCSPIIFPGLHESTSTECMVYTDRASTPVRFPTHDMGVMVQAETESRQVGTPVVETVEQGTGTKRMRMVNCTTSMPQVSFSEKSSATTHVHVMHKNMSTDNIHMTDQQTNTLDVGAAYRDSIVPLSKPMVNRSTCTPHIVMETRDTSPERPFMVERASSPKRTIMLHKAVMACKADLMQSKEKFHAPGDKTKPLRPIKDRKKKHDLASIHEDSMEGLSDESEDMTSQESLCSLSPLPRSPCQMVDRALSPLMPPPFVCPPMPGLRGPIPGPRGFGTGIRGLRGRSAFGEAMPRLPGPTRVLTHRERLWPSAPNLHKTENSSSMFNFDGSHPSPIRWQVEMATNTPELCVESKGTSTPPVSTEDKAICTESYSVESKMAACINKLKTVSERLEQKQSPLLMKKPLFLTSKSATSPSSSENEANTPGAVIRCKSVEGKLDDSDFSPLRSSLSDRKSSPSDLTSSSDSNEAQDMTSDGLRLSMARRHQALARKQRLDISQLLRSASLPESEHLQITAALSAETAAAAAVKSSISTPSSPSASPRPKIKTIHTQVIPKLNLDDFKKPRRERSRDPKRQKPTKKTPPPPSGEDTMSTSGSTSSSPARPTSMPASVQRRRHSSGTESLQGKIGMQRERLQSQLPFEERKSLTHQLVQHTSTPGTSKIDAACPTTRSVQKQRRQRPVPTLHVMHEADENPPVVVKSKKDKLKTSLR